MPSVPFARYAHQRYPALIVLTGGGPALAQWAPSFPSSQMLRLDPFFFFATSLPYFFFEARIVTRPLQFFLPTLEENCLFVK